MVGGTIGLNFRQLEVWQRLKARNPRYARLEQKGFAEPILVKLMQRIGIGLVGERADLPRPQVEALASHVLIYLSSVLSLLAGLAVVIAHNRWSGGWPVIITVLGWLMVIGGVIRIVVPQVVQTVAATSMSGCRHHRRCNSLRRAWRLFEFQGL